MTEMIKVNCANCGKSLEFPAWDIQRRRRAGNKNFYCDRKCYKEHQRRKKLLKAQDMKKLRYSKNGSTRLTLKEIGDKFGVSPQRVHAVLREAE